MIDLSMQFGRVLDWYRGSVFDWAVKGSRLLRIIKFKPGRELNRTISLPSSNPTLIYEHGWNYLTKNLGHKQVGRFTEPQLRYHRQKLDLQYPPNDRVEHLGSLFAPPWRPIDCHWNSPRQCGWQQSLSSNQLFLSSLFESRWPYCDWHRVYWAHVEIPQESQP